MPERAPVYFLILAVAGLVGAVATFVRVRAGKAGSPALPAAFLVFAALGLALYLQAEEGLRNGLAAVLVALLIFDLIWKAGKRQA